MSAGAFDLVSLVASIPTLAGYEPAPGKAVLLGLTGDDGRWALSGMGIFEMGRLGAADYREDLLPGLLGQGECGVALVGYEDGRGQTAAEGERLEGALRGMRGVRLLQVVWVRDGRMCSQVDPLGSRIPSIGEVPQAAGLVFAGRSSAGSRRDLEAAFRAGSGAVERVEAVQRAVERIGGLHEATARDKVCEAAGMLCRSEVPVQEWPAVTLASLLQAVSIVELRDTVLGWLLADERRPMSRYPRFEELVESTAFRPGPGDQLAMIERLRVAYVSVPRGVMAAQLGAVLALYAWTCGNGAIANIVQTDALSMDPGNTMLRLLGQALSRGLRGPLFAKV